MRLRYLSKGTQQYVYAQLSSPESYILQVLGLPFLVAINKLKYFETKIYRVILNRDSDKSQKKVGFLDSAIILKKHLNQFLFCTSFNFIKME